MRFMLLEYLWQRILQDQHTQREKNPLRSDKRFRADIPKIIWFQSLTNHKNYIYLIRLAIDDYYKLNNHHNELLFLLENRIS